MPITHFLLKYYSLSIPITICITNFVLKYLSYPLFIPIAYKQIIIIFFDYIHHNAVVDIILLIVEWCLNSFIVFLVFVIMWCCHCVAIHHINETQLWFGCLGLFMGEFGMCFEHILVTVVLDTTRSCRYGNDQYLKSWSLPRWRALPSQSWSTGPSQSIWDLIFEWSIVFDFPNCMLKNWTSSRLWLLLGMGNVIRCGHHWYSHKKIINWWKFGWNIKLKSCLINNLLMGGPMFNQ